MDTTVIHVFVIGLGNAHHEFVFVNAKLRGFPIESNAGCFSSRGRSDNDAVALQNYSWQSRS